MPKDSIEERIKNAIIGGMEAPEIVVDYDTAWPERFDHEAGRIRTALGKSALVVEHIGSTAVPGLAAKPIIDILLVVEDSNDEPSCLPALEEAGYVPQVRERDFHEHRMFRTADKDVHIHVFSPDSPEIECYLLLRDRLRDNDEDRELYARTKRELVNENWATMQHYVGLRLDVVLHGRPRRSGAKLTGVTIEIMLRAWFKVTALRLYKGVGLAVEGIAISKNLGKRKTSQFDCLHVTWS